MTTATAPAPAPACLPTIRYRLTTDDTTWCLEWRCGMKWLRVYGPTTEFAAREQMSLLLNMTI